MAKLPFAVCDAHFHFWDTAERPNPNLGGIVRLAPVYLHGEFQADVGGNLDLDSVSLVRRTVPFVRGPVRDFATQTRTTSWF
jgi:predicted TIM-barrel fold metal-dependent hydrolase